jgi:hypothetical protein
MATLPIAGSGLAGERRRRPPEDRAGVHTEALVQSKNEFRKYARYAEMVVNYFTSGSR